MHLKVFECLCFYSNTQPHRGKFNPRAFSGAFLGYPPGQKAYKLFYFNIKKVITSRDVVCHEHLFSFNPDFPTSSVIPRQCDTKVQEDCFPTVPTSFVPDAIPDDVPIHPPLNIGHVHPTQTTQIDAQPIQELLLSSSQNVVQSSLRQSTRKRQIPSWLNDYHVNIVAFLDSLPVFSSTHMSFLANLAKVPEPHSFKQAKLSDDWIKAMALEIQALEENRT
ncbi:hypothetical protein LIER_40831 [Lithospermum erythrorhizon]|uniref:Retroviral polymerase SH3-like domain-containing protein n=1 Tax=Lithospermum erythrorhizon TaxID=34254 RepID=A0AAV3R5Z3_LITER